MCVVRSWSSSCCYCFFSSRRRHTRCALVTGVQTCALPIFERARADLAVQLPNLDASLRDLFGHLDLHLGRSLGAEALSGAGLDRLAARLEGWSANLEGLSHWTAFHAQIGRASCRERVCQYV